MKKVFLCIILLIPAILSTSCTKQNSSLKIEPASLTENSEININMLFRSFTYSLYGEESECAIYNGKSIKYMDLDTSSGVSSFVFLSDIDILYSYFNVKDKNELTDKLGQYCYYNHYDDLIVYVFYNYYLGEPYTENIVIVKDGTVYHLIDSTQKDWFPDAVYREGDHFHIVYPEFNLGEDEYIRCKTVDLKTLEAKAFYVPITNWANKAHIFAFFTFNDLYIIQYSVLNQNDITVFDPVSQKVLTQKSFPDNIQLSRDEQHMYLLDMKDPENLSVEITEVDPISFEPRSNPFSVSADIPQVLSFSSAMVSHPFCKDGIIYLPLQNWADTSIYYVLVIDTLSQKATSLITIDCIDRALDIRFLENRKLLYDEKGSLS